jgi:hypothetical protein
MPEHARIHEELRKNRDESLKLVDRQLPELGNCKFADYFTAAIGATLYQKFMANYTWKMWNIPGNELETSMVWADRFHHATRRRTSRRQRAGCQATTRSSSRTTRLARDSIQVYPKAGWNAVWNAMVGRSTPHPGPGCRNPGRAQGCPRAACQRRQALTSRTITRSSARSTSTSSGARTDCPTPAA